MNPTDKLTDEALEQYAQDYWPKQGDAVLMARELLAHRRASQAAPALKICQFCHDYGASSCTCFDEAEMGAAKAAPVPPDGLRVPKTLTAAQLADACMSYRHDYGLMIGDEREDVRREAAEWWRCFEKTLNDPPTHLRAALSASPAQEGGK